MKCLSVAEFPYLSNGKTKSRPFMLVIRNHMFISLIIVSYFKLCLLSLFLPYYRDIMRCDIVFRKITIESDAVELGKLLYNNLLFGENSFRTDRTFATSTALPYNVDSNESAIKSSPL